MVIFSNFLLKVSFLCCYAAPQFSLQLLPRCPQWEQLKLSGATSQWHFNDSTTAPHTERQERYEHLLKIGPLDTHAHTQMSEPPFVLPATETVGDGWSLIKSIHRDGFVYACMRVCVCVISAWHHHHLPGTAIMAGILERVQERDGGRMTERGGS